jgi:hypothetical protein
MKMSVESLQVARRRIAQMDDETLLRAYGTCKLGPIGPDDPWAVRMLLYEEEIDRRTNPNSEES